MAVAATEQFNLLPEKERVKFIRRRRQRLSMTAIRLAILGCLILGAVYFFWCSWTVVRINRLEANIAWLEPQITKADQVLQEIDAAENELAARESIRREQRDWAAVIETIGQQQPANLWLDSFSAGSGGYLQISGQATDLAAVGGFIYALNRLPGFQLFMLQEAKETLAAENLNFDKMLLEIPTTVDPLTENSSIEGASSGRTVLESELSGTSSDSASSDALSFDSASSDKIPFDSASSDSILMKDQTGGVILVEFRILGKMAGD